MSFPKLDLEKFFCQQFEIQVVTTLDQELYSQMLGSGIFSNYRENEPNMVIKNYKVKNNTYSLFFQAFWPKDKKTGKIFMVNDLDYHVGKGKLSHREPLKVSFPKLFSFFQKTDSVCRERVTGSFEFPLSKFQPIIDLPYSRPDLVAQKKVEICGLDLIVQASDRNYHQFISVNEETVSQKVRFFREQNILSSQLIKDMLEESHTCARELVRKRKAR